MNYRLLARLTSRTTDNRNPGDMVGYVATIVLPRGWDWNMPRPGGADIPSERETKQCTHWR